MTSTPAQGSAAAADEHDLPALLDDGLSLFEAEVRRIQADDWDKPTPCDDWTVRDLVGHVVGTMTAGGLILRGEQVPAPTARPGDVLGEETTEEVADRVQELARGFRSGLGGADLTATRDTPMGPRTMRDGLAFPIVDLAIHTWDLGTALGEPVELPTPLLAFADEFSKGSPESVLRNPRAFGPAVEPPSDASPTEELVSFLGREVPAHLRAATRSTGDAPASTTTPRPVWPDEQPDIPDADWEALNGEARSGSSGWVADQLKAIDEAGTTEAVDVQGMAVVVMTMLGRRSGEPRRVPVMKVEHEGIYAAVASKGGAPEHPEWYRNLVAHPGVLLQDGTRTSRRIAREIEGAERSTWWARCVNAFPPYAEYAEKSGDRVIPVLLLEPVAEDVEDA